MNIEIKNDLINIANAMGNDWKVDLLNIWENNGHIFNNKMKGVKIFFIVDWKDTKRINASLSIGHNNYMQKLDLTCSFNRNRTPLSIVKDLESKIIKFIPEKYEQYINYQKQEKEKKEKKEILKNFISSLLDSTSSSYSQYFLRGKKNNVDVNLSSYSNNKSFSLELHNLNDEQLVKILKTIGR